LAALISEVIENSIADGLGIEAGDILLSIDERSINDILDYQFLSREDFLVMDIQKADKEIWSIEIARDYDEDLGLVFDDIVFDKMKVCRNRCIFCFIDQLPRKMRKTMYVKDDDYRYSFLCGNFITLTNLTEEDWQKIIEMRLSSLYISVHALQADIRSMMMGNHKAAGIKEGLERLKDADIEMHTQIVLCPGINDGKILEDTIEGLAKLYPAVSSIGIVPVGLTAHREKLQDLRGVSSEEAKNLISTINRYQQRFRSEFECGLVYLADEFYVKAGIHVPEAAYYDDYAQIENGIGLCRILLDEFAAEELSLPESVSEREVYLVTGESALPVMEEITAGMNRIKGLKARLIPVKNTYFGGQVSVTGLLVGSDLITALGKDYAGKRVIIPEIVFKEGQDNFLDDITLADIKISSGADIKIVDGTAQSLLNAVIKDF